MNPPAGWHPDPYDPSIDRYWDGQQWTGHTRPKGAYAPTQAFGAADAGDPANNGKKRKTWPWVLGAGVLGFAVLGSVVDTEDKKDAPAAVVATTTSSAAPTTTTAPRTTTTTVPPTTTATTAPAVVPLVPQVETTTTVYTPPPAPAYTPLRRLSTRLRPRRSTRRLRLRGNRPCRTGTVMRRRLPGLLQSLRASRVMELISTGTRTALPATSSVDRPDGCG